MGHAWGNTDEGRGARVIGGNGLIARLRSICGPDRVIAQKDQMRTYESDGLLQYRGSSLAVALPESSAEVQAVVRACHHARAPWVARGSGTGLSGGAVPVADGVVIALTRMRSILEVDLDN